MTKHWVNLFLGTAGTVAILAFSPAANANLVLNGGFQDGSPVLGSPGYEQVDVGDSNPMPNWTVTAGNLDWIHGYWKGSSNSILDYSVDLSGITQVTVQQLITGLVTNTWYSLTFDTALNPDHADTSQSLAWTLGAQGNSAVGTTNPNTSWTGNIFSFLWTGGTSALLKFSSTVPPNSNCCFGPALDNVALNAIVPLPAALPLLAAGLGAMGYLGRSRRRRGTFAA